MPKLKTHKGAKARFRRTGTGKIVRMKGLSSHLRRKKPKKTRRLYSRTLPASPTISRAMKALLPYS